MNIFMTQLVHKAEAVNNLAMPTGRMTHVPKWPDPNLHQLDGRYRQKLRNTSEISCRLPLNYTVYASFRVR
jgi:hypothetical protein